MVFSHRMAALAAVVAIPLGIAATSYVLTDNPEQPKAPPKVELQSDSPSSAPASPRPTPSDEKISPPPVSEHTGDRPGGTPSNDHRGNDDTANRDDTGSSDDSDDDGRGDHDDDGPGDDG